MRFRPTCLSLLAVIAGSSLTVLPARAAEPACALEGQPTLEGRIRGAATTHRDLSRRVDARLGEEIEVYLVMPGTLNGRRVIFSDEGTAGRVSWSGSGCPPLSVAWRRVEPRMEHVATRAPNASINIYANAVVFGPSHGRWLGYDRIEYFETPLPPPKDAPPGQPATMRVVRDARPTSPAAPRPEGQEGLGVMRLAATVTVGDKSYATAGAEDAPSGQIADRVFRYTYRSGDGFLGWLTAFYNVPYLFGSAGEGANNQTERMIGADCADILVGALRRAGLRKLRYSNVGGVMDQLGKVAGPALVRQCPASALASCPSVAEPPLRFGSDVRPGDVLAVDYVGAEDLPRAWDHIVVLVEDRGPNGQPDGVLGPHDIVADSGDAQALKLAPLNDQGTVRVLIARPKGVPLR